MGESGGWALLIGALLVGYGLSYVPSNQFVWGIATGVVCTVVLALTISAWSKKELARRAKKRGKAS